MGQQHNTHVANATGEDIKVILTDNDGRNTQQFIQAGQHVNIPTPHGRNTASVSIKGTNPQTKQLEWNPRAVGVYSDDSDRSFIVKKEGDEIQVVRAKYGTIWQEETGLRT